MVRRKSECSASGDAGAGAQETSYEIKPKSWRVRDMPERLRPREEMERVGVEHVSDEVLLAIVLRSGVRGTSVVDLARGLLRQYGSLTAMASVPVEELASVRGMGRVRSQVLAAALELAKRLAEEKAPLRGSLKTPSDVARLLREKARSLDREIFWVLPLDAKNRLKRDPVEISAGLLDASLVHAREVFRAAVGKGAAAIVLAHNHPSGDPSPSTEDIRLTKELVAAGKVVDIRVVDHVVLGKPCEGRAQDFVSMREDGLVNFG